MKSSAYLFLLYLSLSPAVSAAGQADPLLYWKKLLHFGESRSRVVSNEFFLSPSGHTDYIAELDRTIELLNSPHGQEIACNFPARYQWLKTIRTDIPLYELKHCTELNEFKQGFQKQTLSVSFASEYLDNPVSSFGHTMLVFHDKDKPLLSADAIHFAAKTDDRDGFFTYVYKGITGGYRGYFFRDPFFKKQFQYNIQEQRYVHLYTLDLSDEQIERIIHHLFELRKATFNYYFIKENCAYQIAALLDIVSDDISFSESGFVLPIEVIKAHRQQYKDKTVLPPSTLVLRHLLDTLGTTEQGQFEAVIAGARLPDNALSNQVKYALATYYEYHFRKNRVAQANYKRVMRLNYEPPALDVKSPEPLERQGFSRMSAAYMRQGHDESMLLGYRPFLVDLLDVPQPHEEAYELSVFNPIIQVNKATTSLYQLDLFSIKSLPPRSRYFKPVSWHFYTGFNRRNPTEDLDYEVEFGLGMTYQLSVLRLNYALNGGIDLTTGDYYYKPNATLLTRLGDSANIGLNVSEKYYEEKKYIERNAYVNLRFGHSALQAAYTTQSSNRDERVIISLFKYFN